MKKFLIEKINSEKIFSHDQKKCDHEIIRDYIDLTPDKSQIIFYCTKCMEDFTSPLVPKYKIK
jgi:hypothetical protein